MTPKNYAINIPLVIHGNSINTGQSLAAKSDNKSILIDDDSIIQSIWKIKAQLFDIDLYIYSCTDELDTGLTHLCL